MDDATRKNSSDEQPPDEKRSGASSTEFTQQSPTTREQERQNRYNYAIPRSDPLDQTLEGRTAGPSKTMHTASPVIPSPAPIQSAQPAYTSSQPPQPPPPGQPIY